MSITTGDRVRNTRPVIFDVFENRSGRSGGVPVGSLATVGEEALPDMWFDQGIMDRAYEVVA